MKLVIVMLSFMCAVECILVISANDALDKTETYRQLSMKQAFFEGCLNNSNKHFSECEADAADYLKENLANGN